MVWHGLISISRSWCWLLTTPHVLQFNSVRAPRGDSHRFHRWRARSHKAAPSHSHSEPSHKPVLSPALQTHPLLMDLFGFNLLLRELFYLLDYWFSTKGYSSGTRWKTDGRDVGGKVWARYVGKELGASRPSPKAPLSPNHPVLTSLEVPQSLSFWVFMEDSWLGYYW